MAEGGNAGVRLAYYGDDFTGSTDTLAAAVAAGWRAALFMDVPDAQDMARFGPLDCVGVAGTARAMAPQEMDLALPRVFAGLAATGAAVVHYKTCSTFDSAPHVGSIGHAVGLARRALGCGPAHIVGGQPNLGRFCVYANLFARAGQGGPLYRLDRHPTMSRHPVTPMDEADLRLHLQRQGLSAIASFDTQMLAAPAAARRESLRLMVAAGVDAVLFDVAGEEHLPGIGELLWEQCGGMAPVLAVGPTGVVQALLAARQPATAHRLNAGAPASWHNTKAGVAAPVDQTFIIAGSRSPVTAQQIHAAEQAGFVSVQIDAAALVDRGESYGECVAGVVLQALREGRSVVAHSTFADDTHAAQPGFTRALALGCGRLLTQVLQRHPLARVGLAGGDTSSLAVQSWGIRALTLSYVLSPGVAVCRVHAPGKVQDGIELMLKGGQMGPPELFEMLRG
jgi:uncharacterized protein YgbK (DUF1537 family)